jgi:hypothetical protein
MALISCPECKSNISNLASSCIQCGYPLEESNKTTIENSAPSNCGVMNSAEVLEENKKHVSGKLLIGILFFPYIFSWITLQRGYSNLLRVVSMSWMIFLLVGINSGSHTNTNKVSNLRASQPHVIANAYTSYGLSNADLAWHAKNTYGWNCNSVVRKAPQTGGFYFITCGNGKRLRVYPRANKHPRITNENGGWN